MDLRFSLRSTLGLAMSLVLAGTFASACGDDDDAGPPDGPDAGNPDTTPNPRFDSGGGDAGPPPRTRFSRPSHGSRIDISEDDTIVVAANLDTGSVSVFDVTYPGNGAPPAVTKKAELPTCAEPTQVALNPNGDRAFVVCRKDQKVVRLDNLRATPTKGPEAKVGSEPTGIALTPKATKAWVANWVDGTTTEIDTNTMGVVGTVDLNAALVATGTLGNVTARPALAHPRSVAITNNNDDAEDDESVFVTEFFSQQKEALAANGSNADVARQGFVYRINPKDKSVTTIPLAPIADIGFKDSEGVTAGCAPNQITSINIQGSFAYVLSICASPRGPLGVRGQPASCTENVQCGANGGVCNMTTNTCAPNRVSVKTVQTPAVHVIDIGGNKVVASVSLNHEMETFFNAKSVPDTSARRYPLHVWDIAFVPGTLNAYLPARGSDAVYRVNFNATYETKAVDSVGFGDRGFIALDQGALDATKQGKLPSGIAMAHRSKTDSADRFAFVVNEATNNITVLDLKADNIAGIAANALVVPSAPAPADAKTRDRIEGKRLFSTGLGRWSLNGQSWVACETCHVDGLSDQLTWSHFRGNRQTPSIDQTVGKKNPSLIRVNAWTAHADEVSDHEAGALRLTSGGVGSIVKNLNLDFSAQINFPGNGHGGLSGSSMAAADPASSSALVGEVSVLDDWKKLAVYMSAIRTPKKPSNIDAAKVAEGKTVFTTANCQGCHGGELWTISKVFYTPDATKTLTNALRQKSWTQAVADASFPAALLPATDAAYQTMRYNNEATGANPAAFDSLTCLLRNVGTFNKAEPGVGVSELRQNGAGAQGGGAGGITGYNVPSLLGMAVNAPFLHAGNARTLEALLSEPFRSHHAALADAEFLGPNDAAAATKRAALVQFLLSLDDDAAVVAIPTLGATGGDFCALP